MKFSDKIERTNLTNVFAKFSEKAWEENDESNSNLWDIVKENVGKQNNSPVHLYKVPARCLKIGQDIFTKDGKVLAYRSE